MVCKLLKAPYSLNQAPKYWYKRLSKFLLKKLGLYQMNTNHSIFVIDVGIKGPDVSIFVDDIKIMGIKGSKVIERVKKKLAAAFDMVDIDPISFYFGLKIERDCIIKILKLY